MGFDGTINSILADQTEGAPEPEVGMGVTFLYPGDRYPGTVVEVVSFKSGPHKGAARLLKVRHDDFEAVPGTGQHEPQYKITPRADGPTIDLTRRAGGGWQVKGGGGRVAVGYRDAYRDPHF